MLNKTRLVLFIAILSTAAGALVFRTPATLFLLATLIAAPLLASALGQWMSRGLRISRQMPLVGTVGDEVRARLTVRNGGLIPALLVHAQGRGADETPKRAGWRKDKIEPNSVAPARADEPAFFEVVGEGELVVPILMPGARFSGEVAWRLKRRGLYAWPGARAGTVDPVGLSDPLIARDAPAQLLILPRPLKLRRLQLGGGSPSVQPLQRASAAADAADVHGVRPYQPGEGGRRIHWRATARTGELHVIEWEEETATDLTILIDAHSPAIVGKPGEDSLEHSITAAASIAAFLLESGQRVRLFWWADEPATGVANGAQRVAPGKPSYDAKDAGANNSLHKTSGGARLMRVEARHQAGLSEILTALAQVAPCQNSGATLSQLSARVQRETGDFGALLIGSDVASWAEALASWPTSQGRTGAHGLAFESASFQNARAGGFTLRAGALVTATMQRVDASNQSTAAALPARVRRAKRDEPLADILEKNF